LDSSSKNLWRLVFREIAHRKGNFSLGLLAVSAAVGCLVGSLTLLKANEVRTAEILAAKERELEQSIALREQQVAEAGRQYQDSMRKITKGLGFNILILPNDQDLNELHVEGTLSRTMPYDYVARLANSKIVTVNHLLPMVMKKVRWEERKQPIVLIGTKGEVPQMHREPGAQKPLQDPVAPGKAVLGYQLHARHNLSKGETITLMGRQFAVSEVYEERGTADDSTVWINLGEAQEILGMQNLVNAILALECNCAAADRIGEIRGEISEILPGTQVIERGPPALARAEARKKAKQEADEALTREKASAVKALKAEQAGRQLVRNQLGYYAGVLVPLVVAASGLWIGLLAYTNVRQRSAEIGILRAMGFRSAQILFIFLGKALLMGFAGAAVGYAAGVVFGAASGDFSQTAAAVPAAFTTQLLLLSFLLALVLSGLASWIPAMLAARQDPALVLQEE
jgi:ABC-type lipoprotein release transport system permease subunit